MTSVNINLDAFLDRGNEIVDTITRDGRMAASFLPKYSLSPGAKNVLTHKLTVGTGAFDDITTIALAQIRVTFTLDWQQLLEENFAASLFRVKKATQSYCAVEDRLLFLGQRTRPAGLQLPYSGAVPARVGNIPGAEIEQGSEHDGLIDPTQMVVLPSNLANLFDAVGKGFAYLQSNGTGGPFAIGMAPNVYDRANRTVQGFVESDRERIESLLGSKVLRVSVLPPDTAFIMGGAADGTSNGSQAITGPVDRAVALDPELHYLDRTVAPGQYQFAITGCLALRIKDSSGIVRIDF